MEDVADSETLAPFPASARIAAAYPALVATWESGVVPVSRMKPSTLASAPLLGPVQVPETVTDGPLGCLEPPRSLREDQSRRSATGASTCRPPEAPMITPSTTPVLPFAPEAMTPAQLAAVIG